MKKKIAVISGGYSKEEVISKLSGKVIIETLDKNLFDAYMVVINKNKWYVLINNQEILINKNNFSFSNNETEICFDAIFMAIHGTPGEDGKLQAYFEMLNIPVTTCNSFVSALTFNKYACKTFLKDYNIATAKAVLARKNDTFNTTSLIKKLGLPLFIKPNNGGSSFGVTKVETEEEILPAIEKAMIEDSEIIIEEFIDGGEFTCGVFCSEKENYVLPITQIISKTTFFDFKAKYEGLSEEITPARLDNTQTEECKELSQRIYKLLNCNGVVRIDYLLKNNKFYFMEVNTVPGMSKESIVPQQVRAMGMSVSNFYTLLINDAIERN